MTSSPVKAAPALESPPARESGTAGQTLRLGVVPYLNVQPMVRSLRNEPSVTLESAIPSDLAGRLHTGSVDLGTVPSVEYAVGEYALVPGVAIGSRGAVKSVVLHHTRPLTAVRRVALDASSRTSVALLRLLLLERLGHEPEYVTMPPSLEAMLDVADAALLIGDPALDARRDGPTLDLGEEWTRLTGLPFVYAVWAGPVGRVRGETVVLLQRALDLGLDAFDAIAAEWAAGDPERTLCYTKYLRTNMNYRLGEEELQGLALFLRRAFEAGLVPRLPEIRFHATA